jgi:transposase
MSEKVPIAEIARRLGRSRQTIYNQLKREEPTSARKRTSKLDEYKPYLESRLARFDLPATVLLEEIRRKGYDGGLSILKEYVAGVKQREVRRLVARFETEPGRQAQIDWGSCGTIWHEGRRRRLSLFVFVLGYSRVIWARFVVSERQPVLFELLEQAFRELGGVPRELLVDNMRQIVAQARLGERAAVLQPSFRDFADHWGFEVEACPAYWPRAKGKVERGVGYIKRSFLEGRSSHGLEDLNGQLQAWLTGVANVRSHGTLKQRPIDRLSDDRAAMRPLVRVSYPAAERSLRHVDHDARISYRGVLYSVDPEIVQGRRGQLVEIELSVDEQLRVYHQGQLVGRHRLQPSGSPPQDDPLHARKRRVLRQRPLDRVPRGRGPRFDQAAPDALAAVRDVAPVVDQRSLMAYEGRA